MIVIVVNPKERQHPNIVGGFQSKCGIGPLAANKKIENDKYDADDQARPNC